MTVGIKKAKPEVQEKKRTRKKSKEKDKETGRGKTRPPKMHRETLSETRAGGGGGHRSGGFGAGVEKGKGGNPGRKR